jgi:hypothetical protein
MTTKPTPEQARAYAEALIAWSEGKKVEYRIADAGPAWCPVDWSGTFPTLCYACEYRIVPDPPKPLEGWVNVYPATALSEGALYKSRADADKYAAYDRLDCVRVREILDNEIVVDKAEWEELRRNEAALKAAIYDNNQRFPKGEIFARAKLFGAKL